MNLKWESSGPECRSKVGKRMMNTSIADTIGVRDGGGGQGGQLPPQFGQFVDMNSGRECKLFGQNPIHV